MCLIRSYSIHALAKSSAGIRTPKLTAHSRQLFKLAFLFGIKMTDIETYEDRLQFNTEEGIVNVEFSTDDGIVPAMMQIELTDVVKSLNKLQSINTVQKRRIEEQLSEHWDKIKENVVDTLQTLNPSDDSFHNLCIDILSKYFEYEEEIHAVAGIIKRLLG
jgi:hypothetical protein